VPCSRVRSLLLCGAAALPRANAAPPRAAERCAAGPRACSRLPPVLDIEHWTRIKPEYILVRKATDELSKNGTLHDETLRELLDKYGETISRKIVLMMGWFNMLSLF
jgi:hypothetical protein